MSYNTHFALWKYYKSWALRTPFEQTEMYMWLWKRADYHLNELKKLEDLIKWKLQ